MLFKSTVLVKISEVKVCREIYNRIIAKGKSKKLALIAVCNKLLKQAFAVAKSGIIYDENYRSTLVKN